MAASYVKKWVRASDANNTATHFDLESDLISWMDANKSIGEKEAFVKVVVWERTS